MRLGAWCFAACCWGWMDSWMAGRLHAIMGRSRSSPTTALPLAGAHCLASYRCWSLEIPCVGGCGWVWVCTRWNETAAASAGTYSHARRQAYLLCVLLLLLRDIMVPMRCDGWL
ncbi:hypothetical protein BZA05DRAFT_253998 [Tricharina praecox]|uniref:uncharacterized protein n=1 Tax=Tricharina praecox TaxID=43433 RepID=UPI00221F6BF8|nr:uncharacterized protein BZA05DRAFT_253998 [Tricharina praecox]KAI5854941.1 hypothetical protein BZA05DRAFT_253998 [Tricharina praecox]